ncbi:glycerate kinase [Nesterenkonia alba]|uniref:glycerate kinase n=1 Tax=Nesterenkonia alba TaxID=515814 RepID=UPI0003B6D44E
MKIVCAPDSFKGSASAGEAAAALAAGAQQVFGQAEIIQLPFADGGEGTLDALLEAWGSQAETVEVVDAIGRPTTARFGRSPDGRTAIIEAAEGNGLPAVSDVPLQPRRADTYGVGLIAAAALQTGAEEILLCIGGSASTDGGTGLLTALGAQFLDAAAAAVAPGGEGLSRIASIDLTGLHPRAREVRWRIAVDVDNPLTGPRGAAAVFGPQKGADEHDVVALDAGLTHLSGVLAEHTGTAADDLRTRAGFGAAGGIPVTLVSLLGAEVVPGSTMVAEAVGLAEALTGADIVLTGEGRLDSQSLAGKVVDAVSSRAPEDAAVVVICGGLQLSPAECRAAGITAAFSIADGPADLARLQARAAQLIEDTAAHACHLLARR